MDWREFLKPTKCKIIAFLLIFLFAPLPVLVTKGQDIESPRMNSDLADVLRKEAFREV